MINFDEEIKRFKPSLELDDAEKAVMNENENDMVELMVQMMQEYRER